MINISWNKLRPWGKDNSQNGAFEALCCQLAEYETAPPTAKFVRKGAPDAGLECYRILSNSEEWGWQTKFFLSPPDSGQWQQIDESVRTALAKHPSLVRLTIALPADRQDPRVPQQQWFMDQWDEHVKKWNGWVAAKQRVVTFDYWGEHEIFERLSRSEHAGRTRFWFDEHLFDAQWFEKRWNETVASAGPRYSRELNIELPISRVFDGLGKTQPFEDRLSSLEGEFQNRLRKIKRELQEDDYAFIKAPFQKLDVAVGQFAVASSAIKARIFAREVLFRASQLAAEASELAFRCSRDLELATGKPETSAVTNQVERLTRSSNAFAQLGSKLSDTLAFLDSPEAQAAGTCGLLLRGDAGTGKTHLFCDVARQRLQHSIPTVLLLGQRFTSNSQPWTQVLQLLDFDGTADEFLGALDTAAQATNRRALILIDALNEGEGRKLWPAHLAAFLQSIAAYERLAVGVSVRTSYEQVVVPQELLGNKLVVVDHDGFGGAVYEATEAFLKHYGINSPNVPLLNPEFNNPLFLKLLSEGLRRAGYTEVPLGFQGITQVFKFFVDSINAKLSRQGLFHERLGLVTNAAEKLARAMTQSKKRWLLLSESQQIVNEVLPSPMYEGSLFQHLLAEGLLVENRAWNAKSNEVEDVVAFAYDRLADHLIGALLLNAHLSETHPEVSFQDAGELHWIIADEDACRRNQGLLEALTIQLPERFDKELPDLIGAARNWEPVRKAFIEGLVWRARSSIRRATSVYINEVILRYRDSYEQFILALITVAANPDHKLNAEFLHGNLIKEKMPDRDAIWSVIIHNDFREGAPTQRLTEWAWKVGDKSHIGDQCVHLAAIALTWFFTTSNRFLRDRATKAWVSLMTRRLHLVPDIIVAFREVDDPYVVERLLAATYGAVCRNPELNHLGAVAQQVYDWIFASGNPPPHVLLRDYARNIVELAICQGAAIKMDRALIRPPYHSRWPNMDVPTEEHMEKLLGKTPSKDEEWSLHDIYSSACGMGDFARYEIQPAANLWSKWRFKTHAKLTPRQMREQFESQLDPQQKVLWLALQKIISEMRIYRRHYRQIELRHEEDQAHRALINERVSLNSRLSSVLTGATKKLFASALAAEEAGTSYNHDEFDGKLLERWVVQRALEFGWTIDRFGRFDRTIQDVHGREPNKPERIGKKYQWLALHEAIARIADNFRTRPQGFMDKAETYVGPWQQLLRDVDPTCLLRKTAGNEGKKATVWWSSFNFDGWDEGSIYKDWLLRTQDLPRPERLLLAVNPKDGSNWLNLEAFLKWEEPRRDGNQSESPTKEVWLSLRGYFVKKKDSGTLVSWASQQTFYNDWMPHSSSTSQVFLREFFWSPAFMYHNIPYYNRNGWTDYGFGRGRCIPAKVLCAVDEYCREKGTHDCSVDDTVRFYIPCQWIAEKLDLVMGEADGLYCDRDGKLIAYDPSIAESGPSCLLFRKDALEGFMQKAGYTLFWTLLGEKNIYDERSSRDPSKRHGRLVLNGGYSIERGNIVGSYGSQFHLP